MSARSGRERVGAAAAAAPTRNAYVSFLAGAYKDALAPLQPLLAALKAARRQAELVRGARAKELYERALALADDAIAAGLLTTDSLIYVTVLRELYSSRLLVATIAIKQQARSEVDESVAMEVAWHDDTTVSLSRQALAALLARWEAGTLFTLSTVELAYCAQEDLLPKDEDSLHIALAELLFMIAADTAFRSPREARGSINTNASHAGITAALRALASLIERSVKLENPSYTPRGTVRLRLFELRSDVAMHLQPLLHTALKDPPNSLLLELRRRGLTAGEEKTLRVVALPFVNSTIPDAQKYMYTNDEMASQRAAADVAKHGLRKCALPECTQQEPHPRAFKVCARCHAVTYCCREHQLQDWKRHKREEGCAAPAAAP